MAADIFTKHFINEIKWVSACNLIGVVSPKKWQDVSRAHNKTCAIRSTKPKTIKACPAVVCSSRQFISKHSIVRARPPTIAMANAVVPPALPPKPPGPGGGQPPSVAAALVSIPAVGAVREKEIRDQNESGVSIARRDVDNKSVTPDCVKNATLFAREFLMRNRSYEDLDDEAGAKSSIPEMTWQQSLYEIGYAVNKSGFLPLFGWPTGVFDTIVAFGAMCEKECNDVDEARHESDVDIPS